MSHVTSLQANPSAPAPPMEAQQVTLEISDWLPSHLLYKYSMCTKDNLAPEVGREKEGRSAEEGVVIWIDWAELWLHGVLAYKGHVWKCGKHSSYLVTLIIMSLW